MNDFELATLSVFGPMAIGGVCGGVLLAWDWMQARLTARRKLRAAMAAKWKGVCQ